MFKNTIYNDNSSLLLQSLLTNTQSTISNLNTINNLSYADMLKSMKEKLEQKTALEKADNEVAELEAKFDKELEQLRTETMIYDMFHDAYITNGIFSSRTKSKLRTQKYNAWNSIFSMQAERLQNQTQIALQTLMRRQLNTLK